MRTAAKVQNVAKIQGILNGSSQNTLFSVGPKTLGSASALEDSLQGRPGKVQQVGEEE